MQQDRVGGEVRFSARQVRVQRRHHLSAFADCRSHALDRFCAHVADGEDAAAGGFQRMAFGSGLRSGENETLRVESDAGTGKPIRIRVGADEQEQMVDRASHFPAGCALPPAHRIQHAIAAFKSADCGTGYKFNIRQAADAVHQIT